MDNIKAAFIKSLLHSVEVGISAAVILCVLFLFQDDVEVMNAIRGAVLSALPIAIASFIPKFARTHPGIPLGDFVNDR